MSEQEILTDVEITTYHQEMGFNFGSMSPIDVVKNGLLKAACGWHNGSGCNIILEHHELTTGYSENKKIELTRKGMKYLWEVYKRKGAS